MQESERLIGGGVSLKAVREGKMKTKICWLIIGFIMGSSVSFLSAARLVGSSGYLSGWSVTVEGEEVCSDPYVWTSVKEIDCD